MSDDTTQTGSDGQIQYEISKEDSFRAFWANAYAEFGYLTYTNDFLLSVESTVQATGSFTTSATGLQFSLCPAALAVVVDAGKKFEVVNGLAARLKVADCEAICNDAEALATAAKVKMVDIDTKLTQLKSDVEFFESGLFDLNGPAMQMTV